MLQDNTLEYQFYLDILTPQKIAGWIWKPKFPSEKVTIEIVEKGKVIGNITANQFRNDLQKLNIGDGFCGFSFSFPKILVDGNAHIFELRSKGDKKPFFTLPSLIIEELVEFEIDEVSDYHISGWIWYPNTPQKDIVIQLLENNKVLIETNADIFREDLRNAKKNDGSCGFNLNFPVSVLDGKQHNFELRCKGVINPFFNISNIQTKKIIPKNEMIEGAIDKIYNDRVKGWIWIPSSPELELSVEAVIGNQIIGRAKANELREDLIQYGKGTGRYGFTIIFQKK